MKLYVVTDNGGLDYEGDYTLVIGVFSSIEKAVEAANKHLLNKSQAKEINFFKVENYPEVDKIDYDDKHSDYAYLDIKEMELDTPIWR